MIFHENKHNKQRKVTRVHKQKKDQTAWAQAEGKEPKINRVVRVMWSAMSEQQKKHYLH